MTSSSANPSLKESDEEIFNLIEREKERQINGLELVASENFTSRAVMEALGTCLTNKYSEGLPGKRYYGGNLIIDEIETLCIKRALAAFDLDENEWGVNVQPYSGSTANFAAYTGLIEPGEKIMGLDLPSGGHLTHGYQTEKKKISATSKYFESYPYVIDGKTGHIDYDDMEKRATEFKPNVLITGGSAYPFDWDYKRFREVADKIGAYLLCDMAHIAGLVAAKLCNNPFEYCDIVTTTTHKTLRGPRAGLIFFRKGKKVSFETGEKSETETYDYEGRINFAVFPGIQGGPHENTIAGIAVALKEAKSDEFKTYAELVKNNCSRLAEELEKLGHRIIGTENHLLLWDLGPHKLNGRKMETLYDLVHVTVNMNTIFGDTSALFPSGVRLGTPALTTRGFKGDDFAEVAQILNEGVEIAKAIENGEVKKFSEFKKGLEEQKEALDKLREKVHQFSLKFPMPGV